MAESGPTAAPSDARAEPNASRESWFRVVLLGLAILVIGFTAILIANSFYPCVPAADSVAQPPLAECAVFLSPWIGVAAAGVVIAGIGYLRVG
jgi:hypothetical protein